MFDPVEQQPLARLGAEVVDSPASRALAKQTAVESIVPQPQPHPHPHTRALTHYCIISDRAGLLFDRVPILIAAISPYWKQVLLKNDGILPLDGQAGRIDAARAKLAFIGPHFNSTQDLCVQTSSCSAECSDDSISVMSGLCAGSVHRSTTAKISWSKATVC
eukprot:COSAG01_NODE_269_length_19814_cov_109.983720_13_plen_162_part_00